MGEDLSSANLSSPNGTSCDHSGVAVRYSPDAGPGMWFDVTQLSDGRLAVAVGQSAEPAEVGRLRSSVGAVLRATGNPEAAVQAAAPGGGSAVPVGVTALCAAVIDRLAAELTYACLGTIRPVLAAPDTQSRVLDAPIGTPANAELVPAATLLLSLGPVDRAAALLEQCTMMRPDQAAEWIVDTPGAGSGALLALLYRQPPAPLTMTLPAAPESLAVVRGQLRQWLALAGADSETAADALLAVGEAASNATEHSVIGALGDVELTVSASVTGSRLRFTVADNGCWKPAPEVPSHRGHGIRLINALVDGADLVTGDQGTTVEMVKEMRI